jgi:hypothetical protein
VPRLARRSLTRRFHASAVQPPCHARPGMRSADAIRQLGVPQNVSAFNHSGILPASFSKPVVGRKPRCDSRHHAQVADVWGSGTRLGTAVALFTVTSWVSSLDLSGLCVR